MKASALRETMASSPVRIARKAVGAWCDRTGEMGIASDNLQRRSHEEQLRSFGATTDPSLPSCAVLGVGHGQVRTLSFSSAPSARSKSSARHAPGENPIWNAAPVASATPKSFPRNR